MALVERAERQARERAQGRVDEVHSDQCRKLGSGRRFIPQAFRSENVGILAIEVYFPDTYVRALCNVGMVQECSTQFFFSSVWEYPSSMELLH